MTALLDLLEALDITLEDVAAEEVTMLLTDELIEEDMLLWTLDVIELDTATED
jgi:hypothetical protein